MILLGMKGVFGKNSFNFFKFYIMQQIPKEESFVNNLEMSLIYSSICFFLLFPVFSDELNDFQQNDGSAQSDIGRGLPTVSSANPTGGLPIGSPGEKPTLYLGTFQILAMPLSSGNLPSNFGTMPTIATPSKKD